MNVVAAEQQKEFAIAQISAARRALTEANDIYAVLDVRGMAVAAVAFFEAQNAGEAATIAKEVQLRAERKAGQMLAVMPKNEGGRMNGRDSLGGNIVLPPSDAPTLDDLDISKMESYRWQLEAEVPEDRFEEYIDEKKAKGYELTAGGLIQIAKALRGVHVSDGSNEWYTPVPYVVSVLSVLGSIDLDPASCDEAQRVIKAGKYYTAEDDGLVQPWHCNLYLNPPYSMPLVEQFTGKAVDQYVAGNIEAAIILVNNSTQPALVSPAVRVPGLFHEGACVILDHGEGRMGRGKAGTGVLLPGR